MRAYNNAYGIHPGDNIHSDALPIRLATTLVDCAMWVAAPYVGEAQQRPSSVGLIGARPARKDSPQRT